MRKEYDFSKSTKNPYVKNKEQISISLEVNIINYFKDLSNKTGISYQSLISSYLTDCAINHWEPNIK